MTRVNSLFIEKTKSIDSLFTAGTLHPDYPENGAELATLKSQGVRAIKLCSFSQGFVPDGPSALAMFDRIQDVNRNGMHTFFVVLDTLYTARQFFGTDPIYTTTPEKIVALARQFPDVNFVGAHMGGLDAPVEELESHLVPLDNLYLDTSNAVHTLTSDQFVRILKRFGPEHVLFGTDWPWFFHSNEVDLIDRLADQAGFDRGEKSALFYGNIAKLLGLS